MYNLFADQNSFVPPLYAKEVLGFDPFGLGVLFHSGTVVCRGGIKVSIRKAVRQNRTKEELSSSAGLVRYSVVYVFVFATSPSIAVIGIALWMLFGVMDSPAINAWVAEASPSKSRGLSMGVFYTITFIPTIPALLVSGYLFSIKPQLPFYANSLMGLVALILLIGFTRNKQKVPHE